MKLKSREIDLTMNETEASAILFALRMYTNVNRHADKAGLGKQHMETVITAINLLSRELP